MFKILRCLKNLKMNQQVTIFGTLVMAIVLLVILAICLVQTSILFTIIQQTSQKITTKQEKRAIEQSSKNIYSYLERRYEQDIHNIYHIQKFFETPLDVQVNDQLFPACKKSTIPQHTLIQDSNLFCYQLLNDVITLPQDDQIDFYRKRVSMLSQYSLLFSIWEDSQLYIFDMPKLQMLMSYPQNFELQNYSVSSRQWYKNYENDHEKNPNQDSYQSPVYLSAVTNDLVTVLVTTIHQNNNLIGLTAQSLVLKDERLQEIPINVIITDNDGQIIFTSINQINDAKDLIYMNNTAYTGFNQSDWELIQAYANHVNLSQYYCDGFSDTFCLYNKYFNRNVQIDAYHNEPQNFTLIVFVNVTFSTQLEEQYKSLMSSLSGQILKIYYIQGMVCFAMIFATAVMIKIIFTPLFQLMVGIKMHIKTLGNNLDRQIFTMTRKLGRKSNIFSALTLKFMSLQEISEKSQIQKSDLCQKIENFSYNRKQSQYDLNDIKSKIQILGIGCATNRFTEIFKSSLNEIYLKKC